MKNEKPMSKKRLATLDDDDIPVVKNNESVGEWEKKHGKGFWGNAKTGYNKDNK